MIAVINEIDRILKSSPFRTLTPKNADVFLLASAAGFHLTSDNVADLATVTVTAGLIELDGEVSFSVNGGTISAVTARSVDVTYAGSPARVTATVLSGADEITRSLVIPVIRDGAAADLTDIDLSPEALKDILEGQITESQLFADLRSRIDLVDAVEGVPGSVSARIKKETDDRVAALTQEASDRRTYVQGYAYSKAETNESLSIQANTITAAYRAYAEDVAEAAIAISAADIRQYAYSKATSDEAITALASTLRSEFASNNGASVAYVQEYAYSKAGTNDAISSMASQLRSEFSSSAGVTAAWVQQYAYSKADTDGAIASQTSDLRSTVGGHTSTIQTQATSINGLSNQYTVKIDNNGYVTGYGLASSYVNGIPTSAFIINADRFAVVAPGVAPKVMFAVGQIAGQTGVGVSGDLIVDDTISARHLKAESITARNLKVGSSDNLIRDPQFKDLAYWGRAGCAVGDWTVVNFSTSWKGGASLYLGSGTGALRESDTPYFNIEPGATYRLVYQVNVPPGFNGRAAVLLYLPGSYWYPMSGALNRRGTWSDGLPVEFDAADAGQFFTFTTLLTVPTDTRNSRALIKIRDHYSSAQLEIGAMSITRVADGSLVGDGVLEARHIVGDTLDVLAAKLGKAQIGPGGALWQGQEFYDTGLGFHLGADGNGNPVFSMASANGGKLLFNPAAGIFKLIKPEIEGQNVAPMTAAISGNLYSAVGDGRQGYGSLTANASGNFQAPLSYLWSITYETANGSTADVGVSGSATGQTASFAGSASRERVYLWTSVQIIDAAGRIATAEKFQFITHGSFTPQ